MLIYKEIETENLFAVFTVTACRRINVRERTDFPRPYDDGSDQYNKSPVSH